MSVALSNEDVKCILTRASKQLWRQLSQEREEKNNTHKTFSLYKIQQLVLETANFYTVYELALSTLCSRVRVLRNMAATKTVSEHAYEGVVEVVPNTLPKPPKCCTQTYSTAYSS
jgi:hypothetical protein